MAKDFQRKPRRDVFAHFERQANKSFRSAEDYKNIQAKWAEARARRDTFLHEHTHLKQKIGNIQITVRPQLGKDPHQLELVVIIHEGVNKHQIKEAASEIASWCECLTQFQGPSPFKGIEHLARIAKGSDGKYKLECSDPHLISEALNQRLADLFMGVEYHRSDCPPDNPPFNSAYCLSEARQLFLSWKIPQQKQDRTIKDCLHRLRSGMPPFETLKPRNGYTHLDGPFTARFISDRIRSWRRRKL